MRLSNAEIARFQRDGFLIFEGLFSVAEVAVLRAEAERIARVESDAVFREGSAGQPKAMFALRERDGPTASAAYRAAAHCPRVLEPVKQALGRTEPYFDDSTAYKLWTAKAEDMKRIMARHPTPVAVSGAPGTAALIYCNLLHASGSNLSAHDRWQLYLSFNTVANRPKDVAEPRPSYVRSTDWSAMETGADDAILAAA